MNLCKGVLATLTVVVLALAGCGTDMDKNDAAGGKGVGGIAARLSLPDGTTITDVHYVISRTGFSRDGHVPVGDSTILTFRVGGIPIANGYTIALDATTSDSSACTGSAGFDIVNNQTTLVSLTLSCGTATDPVGDVIVDGTVEQACPVITAISAIPGEVTLGHSVSLTSELSSTTDPVHWSGTGGTFGSADAYATTFSCVDAGTHTLTVTINTTDCHDAKTVDVVCTLGAACGDGLPNIGEQCDDGNTSNTDLCTNACHNAACGDTYVQGTEECDDGSTTYTGSGDTCGATCLSIICGNTRVDPGETCDDGNTVDTDGCRNNCTLPGCGDGVVSGSEVCDDGNTSNTDACTNACHLAACGDTFIQAGEQCDDGNTAAGDGCSATCQTEVAVDNCTVCRETNCHAFFNGAMDAVAGCFDPGTAGADARAAWTGEMFTAAQVQACVDAVACAHSHHCGVDGTRPAAACYCGAAYPNNGDCGMGAAGTQNGLCIAEFQTATGETAPSAVMTAIGSVDVPSGWAYSLLQCEGTFCLTECQ